MISHSDRLFRARQIHIEHPEWGRRRIAAQLRSEVGVGLRHSTIDVITKPYREQVKSGRSPVFVKPRPAPNKLADAMKEAGFLSYEIFGVTGSPAKPLGLVEPDPQHPLFRNTMNFMIKTRRHEFDVFMANAQRRGWSRSKANSMWIRRINDHYKTKKFPVVGKGVARGGSFLTPDGKPSPWALYKAFEAMLIKDSPLGGDGWGTPRPKGKKKDAPPVRVVDTNKIKTEIAGHQRRVDSLSASYNRATTDSQRKGIQRRIKEQLDTISKLREKL